MADTRLLQRPKASLSRVCLETSAAFLFLAVLGAEVSASAVFTAESQGWSAERGDHRPSPEATGVPRWCELVAGFTPPVAAAPAVAVPSAGARATPAARVAIPDAYLRKAVEEALGKAQGEPVTRGEMATLRTLSAELGVRELTGIEYATNLDRLCLAWGAISNLAPLAGLTSLSGLYLRGNAIVDISPLADLTSLTTLYLSRNPISDVAPLAGLTSLRTLLLHENAIADVSLLADLTSLTRLYLGGNPISEVTPLASLTSLTELVLSDNEIVELGPLAGLTTLTSLRLWRNEIADVAPLAGLTSLTELDLSDNQIVELGPLAGLTTLTSLRLRRNEIVDVAPLADLTSLTELDLTYNEIVELGPLAGLTTLTSLDLWGNDIADVAPLAGLTSLTELDLTHNEIVELGPLAGLTALTSLDLAANEIAEIAPLAALTRLRSLSLSGNELTDLPPGFFADVHGLTYLTLHGNPGAPFTLEAVPVLVTEAAQRPAQVAARITEGAPFAIDVTFDAVDGRLQSAVASMAAGALQSGVLEVWPVGRGPVVVHAIRIEPPPSEYTGVELAAGLPLVLNGLADYSDLEESAYIDLATVFREFDGSTDPTYMTRTSDPAVAAAEQAGTGLRIVPVGPGMATITVTATTTNGRTATRVFDITVPGGRRLGSWRWKLLDGGQDAP